MNNEMTLPAMFKAGLVVIIRKLSMKYIADTVDSLKKGGCNFIEITLDGEDALKQIAFLSSSSDVLVGAGTVLDAASCRLAILAGAKFIVTPILDETVIATAKTYGIPAIIGALTPTEMFKAYKCGADVIKVFPAGPLGPGYLKNILAPLPHLPLMVAGGIGLSDLKGFKDIGIKLFGIGSRLIDKKLISKGEYKEIEAVAKDFVQLVQA